MKTFGKVIIWIVIIAAAGFAIYKFVPEYPHNMMKSLVQPVIDVEAKTRIDQIKNLSVGVKGLDGVTYEMALSKNTGMNCWVYEKEVNEATGQIVSEVVTFMGNGASVNMKDYNDYQGKLYTSCQVKFEFSITGNNVVITPYIDGQKMRLGTEKPTERDKEVLKMIVSQMYGGVQEE